MGAWSIIPPVSETQTCELCGTVNVNDPARCMACGSALRPASHRPREPLPAQEDLDSAADRATFMEEVPGRLVQAASTQPVEATLATEGASRGRDTTTDSHADDGARFVVRLLLPDGDRRTVEVGARAVPLGSGLDRLGIVGDQRVGEQEGRLVVRGDTLYVEPEPGATGLYRRLRGEETLEPGDVVLMGDVAAAYSTLAAAPPVDGDLQVLGGSANSPCGRLTFLRRDGSPGPVHDLPAGKTILGRTDGHINFPNDSRLSRRHVRFFASDKGVVAEDLGSRNGTYLRIRARTALEIGDALRIGAAGLQIRERA